MQQPNHSRGDYSMPYYSYNAPECAHCGKEQGLQEVAGGRQRLYCSDRCRQAAKRKRDKQTKRNSILQYNSELRDLWNQNGIDGLVRTRLEDILVEYGKPAA